MIKLIIIVFSMCLEIFPTECRLYAQGYVSSQECPALCSCSFPLTQPENMTIICSTDHIKEADINQVINTILDELKPNLTLLDVNNTRMSIVPEAICQMVTLQRLFLSNNNIAYLPANCFTKLPQLLSIFLTNNMISNLSVGIFQGLQRLEVLDLDDNILDHIDPRVFSNKSDLIRLEAINLNNNRLTNLDTWPLVRAQVVPGCSVSVKKNRISKFTNELNWNFTCGLPQIQTTIYLDMNPIEHFSDIIYGWNRNEMEFLCMFGMEDDKRDFLITMAYVEFVCDCRDFQLIRILQRFKKIRIFDKTMCKYGNDNKTDRLTSVLLDQLVCDITDQCPEKCKCTKQPSTRTIHVNCHNAGLVGMPLQLPSIKPESTYRYNVTMTGNSLETLECAEYFGRTRTFNAGDSRVISIGEEVWDAFQYMDEVNLERNYIQHIPKMVTALNFSNVELNIANNPMSCNCDDQWLKSWLTSVKSSLTNPNSITCDTPGWVRGKSVLSMTTEFCSGPPYTTADILEIVIPTIGGVVLLNTFLVFLFRKFRIHIYKYVKLHPFDKDECENEDMEFDVFLSCANDDRGFGRQLLAYVEEQGYKVCYHERDFLPGTPIFENIGNAITRSKRVLCLVSNHFINSGYCMAEFSISHNRDVQMRKNRLVAFLLEPCIV